MMTTHATIEELEAGLPDIFASPKDDGELRAIVVRPEKGLRNDLQSCEISLEGGVHGDHWAKGCWLSTEDGKPHPDVQICIMNARCIALIAKSRDRWPLAGDNLFVDLNLTPENLPAGQRLRIGSAIIEITAEPHNGCAAFSQRYGSDAVKFVNGGKWRSLRLRGIYARVVQDGLVSVGDRITKL